MQVGVVVEPGKVLVVVAAGVVERLLFVVVGNGVDVVGVVVVVSGEVSGGMVGQEPNTS